MARFFDGEHAAPHDVAPQLTEGALLLRTTDGGALAVWPFGRIVAVDTPGSRGAVTLALDGQPARLFVDDADLLGRLAQAGVRMPRDRAWRAWHWVALIGSSVAGLIAAALLLDAVPRLVAPLVPAAWEDRLGGLVQAALLHDRHTCKGVAGQRALEALVARLRAAGGIEPIARIAVLNDPMVNALTLPGGRMLIMRGLIDKAEDGAELAGVIAHELGHVAHRDPTTLLLRQFGIGFVAASVGWNDALANAGGIAQNLMTLSYSRRAEAAADAAGEEFLTRAGLRADGLGRFFARLEAIEGHGPVALLATHPPTEERRAHATRSAAGTPPLSDAEWAAVRSICQ
jgi:Zn-dependent protease with chaperone function